VVATFSGLSYMAVPALIGSIATASGTYTVALLAAALPLLVSFALARAAAGGGDEPE
jgi:hypothetical protein